MQPYKNLSGNSGVSGFETGDDHMIIAFQDGRVYLYNYASTGKANIERMKVLAHQGEGLTTFINQFVKNKYAKKLR